MLRSALGNPGPGWGFTVALTAQDGFSPDQARSFASTPQPFNLGRCPAESADPHSTFPLGRLPKVMDALAGGPPTSTTRSTPPVTLSPAVVP